VTDHLRRHGDLENLITDKWLTSDPSFNLLAPEQWAKATAAVVMFYELGDAKELAWRLLSSPTWASELQRPPRWLYGQLISVAISEVGSTVTGPCGRNSIQRILQSIAKGGGPLANANSLGLNLLFKFGYRVACRCLD
jgi:hypothetical protein